jgi:two-component system response regulator (stage 0 sporulation protein A)
MTLFEKKLDAVMRYIVSDHEAERSAIRKEIRDLLADAPSEDGGLEYEVRRVLLDIGVPESLKGHRCLVKAICAACRRPDLIGWITKDIYPTVAKELGMTPSKVERTIRHAIEVAWDRGDLDTLRRYFGNTVSPAKGRPTNAEFIARIANVIRQYAQ